MLSLSCSKKYWLVTGLLLFLFEKSHMVKNCFFIGKSRAGWGRRERFWQQMCDPLLPYLPQTGSLGWTVETFCPLRANFQEKASSPPARSWRAHLVPSVWTLHKLRVAWARGRVRNMCGAGPLSIMSAGQPSSALTWAEKWLYMLGVCALRKLRNPGQVTG